MSTLRIAATELRRLTSGKLPTLALVAVTLVPLLYGALYIYANWDPYGRLDGVPAAVVINDAGAQRDDGSRLQAGQKVYDELTSSDAFSWEKTTEQRARNGVAHGDYSFALVVPHDFSAALLSPGDFEPRRAQLGVITNDANNYLVGTIADRVASQVQRAVATDAGSEAAEQLLMGFGTVHDKTARAADGARQLADGAHQLDDGIDQARQGSGELSSGAHELLDGQQQLAGGADQLADGSAELHTGLGQLAERTSSLPQQTQQLAEGSEKVAEGNQELAARAEELGSASQQLAAHTDEVQQRTAETLREAGVDEEQVQRIIADLDDNPVSNANDEVQQQVSRVRALADGSRQVADGNQALAEAAPQMTSAIQQAHRGAGRLADGAQELQRGQHEALSGTRELASGADQLHSGAGQLDAGSDRLVDGSDELASQLRSGVDDIPNPDARTRTATADTIGDPVGIDEAAQTEAGTYGAGLAPYFLGLALWIGGFVLFLLMRPLSQRALAAGTPAWRVALGGWLPAAVVGVVQAVLLYVVVAHGIGVTPAHPWWTLGFLLLTSFAFTAVVHALNAAFGPKGKFIALVVLVLQLVTAGGTFPWQTTPEVLHPLHAVLPLGYVVDALRQLIYGGVLGEAGTAALVLGGYLVAGLLLSTVAAWRQRVWSPQRLKPELAL
ncbi:YhgE/Pip domain-containing protein [Salinifilum aidingensis]